MFNQRRGFRLVVTALSLGGLVACDSSNQGKSIDFNAHDFEGFESTQLALIAAACSIDGVTGNMTLTVGPNETAYVFKRATDSLVVANALTATGVECTVAPTKRVIINSHDPLVADTQKVIVDYYGGSFSAATAASTFPATNNANIQINLGAGTSDQVKIRGSQYADNLTLGTTSTVSYASIAVGANTTTLPTARTFHDVSMIGVEDVVVSMGPGNDNISALGIAGSPTAATTPNAMAGDITFTAYGGDGNDILTSGALSTTGSNSLYGNAGNDKFIQQKVLAKDIIDGGDDIDLVDYASRTNPVAVTLGYGTAAVAATATLTTPAKANLIDNQSFTLNDGSHTVTFEYEVTGGFVATGGGVLVIDVVSATTAAEVAYATAVAINAVGAGLLITATLPAVATITLTQDTAGVAGNTATSETVIHAGFVLSNPFAGGSDLVALATNDGEATELDDILGSVEHVVGGAGADTLDASHVAGAAHILVGGAGDDTLIGAALADTLYGGQGNDTLIGGATADTLRGGDGDDVLQGGVGDDIIDGGGANCPTAGDVIATCTAATAGNIGVNLLDFSDRAVGADVTCDLSTPSGELVVCGVAGEHDLWVAASIRNLRGGKGNDTLQGDGNANSIWGGEGNDAINGMGANDTLYGEAGNDTIHGGTVADAADSGNDFISGGTGLDSLYGADGNDFLDSDDGMVDVAINCGNQDADIGVTDGQDPAATGCAL